MTKGMVFFIIIFTLIQSLWCFYVGRRLIGSDLPPHARQWLWIGLIVLFVFQWLIPADIWMDRMASDYSPFRTFLYWAGYITTGFLVLLLFAVLFRDLAGWSLFTLEWIAEKTGLDHFAGPLASIGTTLFSIRANLAFVLLSLAITVWGYVDAVKPARIVKIAIPITDLPTEFEGYTIAQFSDVHFGPTIRRAFAQRLTAQVNALDADMVAFTGDVTDGLVEKLRTSVEPLKDIKSKDGKFFVTGNHEYYWDAPGWVARMKELDYRVLTNEHVVIKRGKSKLVIGGIPDLAARHIPLTEAPDIKKAFLDCPDGCPRILLAHQPAETNRAARENVDLVLSGHTHAGQFIPFNLLTKIAQPLLGGLYRVKNTWVYVNRGTAYWGPPNRFGIPSEITLITLQRANGNPNTAPVSR